MAAECYVCAQHVAAMPNAVASNRPLGVCKNCHVLACAGHGLRNASTPEFECLICVPTLLVASTASASADRGLLARDLRALLRRMGGEDALIRSVEDFVARYPDLEGLLAWIDEFQHRDYDATGPAGRYYEQLPFEQRRLLLLAIAILFRLEVRPELLPAPVREIYEAWR